MGDEIGPREAATKPQIPYWHTALLLALLLLVSFGGTRAPHTVGPGWAQAQLYLRTMLWEWLLTAYVWWGARLGRLSLRELIGGHWRTFDDFFKDLVTALGWWFGSLFLRALVMAATGLPRGLNVAEARSRLDFLAPHGVPEMLLWLLVSATAGFCEELLFRGYLQRQGERLLGNRWVALVLVSIVFGLGHGYQGVTMMIQVALLGAVLGAMSLVRRTLRPAMMMHAWQDALSGLLLRALENVH